MSENNKPWVVDVETTNPLGACVSNLNDTIYKSYAICRWPYDYTNPNTGGEFNLNEYQFVWWYGSTTRSSRYVLNYEDSVINWTRQTYDLSQDHHVSIDNYSVFGEPTFGEDPNGNEDVYHSITNHAQERFETEAEAIAYAESVSGPIPAIIFNDGDYLFRVSFRHEVEEGVWIDRTVGLQHVGDPIEIYTVRDLENYYASAMGVDNPFIVRGTASGTTSTDPVSCSTSLNITVFNIDEGTPSTITVEPDFQSIPGSSTVTIVDGDPVVSGTMLENGGGSVTVSDNGNITMLNDGGTFFLNEFGNVGFFASGDASLTANAQVQLGVGGTSVTVENDGFTFRDSTGNVELTADELSRLKDLLD